MYEEQWTLWADYLINMNKWYEKHLCTVLSFLIHVSGWSLWAVSTETWKMSGGDFNQFYGEDFK